jgi:hypothetical protein
VTGEDSTGGPVAGGGRDEEAAWADLIARFDAPEADGGPAPWPAREDLAGPDLAGPARVARADTLPDSLPGPLPPADTVTFSPARQASSADEDEHFVPPTPPPLPSVDPVTKGAWAALFGGPAYLLIATAAGWTVPGIAAFLAVAAFIGGFAVLVLRMDDGPPGADTGGPDDGAVV